MSSEKPTINAPLDSFKVSTQLQVLFQSTKPRMEPCETPDKSTIERFNYPVELHPVNTSDGYRLTMARIPAAGKPVLLLMHSFLSSSAEYTVLGPNMSLALEAWDGGFDVWLANARGNTFSRSHRSLKPTEPEFWNFSFHEVGVYDLPAMIDYTLTVTNRKKLHFVGHSQGAVNFLVMASSLPEYNSKIASAHLNSPVVFWSKNAIPYNLLDSEAIPAIQLMEEVGYYEIGGRTNEHFVDYLKGAIKYGLIGDDFLLMGVWMLLGEDRQGFNRSNLNAILEIFPAGGSIWQAIHFTQTYQSGRFCQYDFGEEQNMVRYGNVTPPDYQLEKITAPIALYYGLNDPLLVEEDLDKLAARLPKLMLKYRHPDPKWNHIDFIFGINGYGVHQDILKLARNYVH
ncbi:lipase 3-like [Sabethes cyaneus]|uniref:lipase 3-like n=1 Tax=Sabethes cyaneus TaxID=53552 RepID=UPI00237ECFF6|nr:lipase 3-like [Sabethes cyaneus]